MSKLHKPDALLLRVMSAIHSTEEKPAPGYRTVDEWAKKWKMKRNRAMKYLRDGITSGIIETRTYRRTLRKDAKPYPIDHYGEKSRPRK